MYSIFKQSDGNWAAEKVITIPPKKVKGWPAPEIQGKYFSGANYCCFRVNDVVIL